MLAWIRSHAGELGRFGAVGIAGVFVNLGVFNLLPLPPLDGASVLEGLSPRHAGAFFHKVRTTPAFGFLGLVIAFNAFPYVAGPVLYFVHAALYGAPLLG